MKAKHKLEHRIWDELKSAGLLEQKILVACSGGADSMALLRVLAQIRPSAQLAVAYVHHGDGEGLYRDEAEAFVAAQAKSLGLSFGRRRHRGPRLESEAELRAFRRSALREMAVEVGADLIALGHHQQDLFETRLLRLIRGVGEEGWRAMAVLRPPWYRPLLTTSREELRKYLQTIGSPWMDDPSNRDPRFLRNWLRWQWLPQLEDRAPGASAAMSRSFEGLVEGLDRNSPRKSLPSGTTLERSLWFTASPPERRRWVAEALKRIGARATRGQLEEITRRLDNRRGEYTFRMKGSQWTVLVRQIRVEGRPILEGSASDKSS